MEEQVVADLREFTFEDVFVVLHAFVLSRVKWKRLHNFVAEVVLTNLVAKCSPEWRLKLAELS